MTNAPPPLPEMPPMKAAKPAGSSDHLAPTASPSSPRLAAAGTRRMRQMVTTIAGGGVGIVLCLVGLELVAKPGLRPTDIGATFEARVDLGAMNQKLKVKPGVMKFTEAEYQEIIAQAQREGQAKAELEFQKELALVQADKERVVGAYQTLYQRANMIAQAAIQLETLAQQLRQQLLAMTNGGRSVVIGVKDLFCGLGSPEACASAHEDRRTMIVEADELSRGDIGRRVKELMAGVEDPASFITREDQRVNGAPSLPRE